MGKHKQSESAKRKLTGSAEKQEKTTRRRFLSSSSLPDFSKNISSDTLDLFSMEGNCELNASSNSSETAPSTNVDDAVTTDTSTTDAVTTDAVPIAIPVAQLPFIQSEGQAFSLPGLIYSSMCDQSFMNQFVPVIANAIAPSIEKAVQSVLQQQTETIKNKQRRSLNSKYSSVMQRSAMQTFRNKYGV
jgi:hypothetical protein